MGRPSYAKERIGLIGKNTYGSIMQIVDYKNSSDITVKFLEHGNFANVQWHKFCDGQVKNVYDKSVFGVGYVGEGGYRPSINNKDTIHYIAWKGMLERCYDSQCQVKQPAYIGCKVDERWHNFQVFAKWVDENYYIIEGQRMHLDKDILVKGNKIYSPDTCVFVPANINSIFTKNDVNRGNLPIGVTKSGNNYRARSMNGEGDDKRVSLGNFKSPLEAFNAYKIYKEQYIKETALKYKNIIPTKLYDAMMRYEVKITD